MKKQLGLALALAVASFGTLAGELSYTYVEGGYVHADIDGTDDVDGFGLNGSAALGENFHIFGGYSMLEGSEDGIDTDVDEMRLGLGYNHAINDRTDFVARAAYERADASVAVPGFGSFDFDSDGYSIEGGFRGLLSMDGTIEGWAMAGFADLDDVEADGINLQIDEEGDDEFYGRVGLQAKFSPTWGVVGEGRFSSDASQYFVGLRASF